MINPADFLKWCAVFNIPTGGGAPGSVTEQQVQQFAFNYAPSTGVDDAFIVNLNPAVAALTNGLIVSMTSGSLQNLTVDPTLQVDSQTPVAITLWGGLSVAPGDIMANSAYLFIYDAADNNFQLLNPSISTASTFLVQSNFYNAAIDSGTSNAYAVTLVPEPQGSFGIGFPIYMQAGGGSTNTGASTLSVNGTVNDIVLWNGNALPSGSIRANGTYWLMWSGSLGKWVLMNPVPQQTIVTLADETSTLPDSFSLGTLMDGLLKISVTDSVAAIMNAVNGTDYWAPGDVITLPGSPTSSLDAATKGYVDSVAAGLNPTAAVEGASTANLTGFTYDNGSSGVGATLTAPAVGAFIEDGITYTTGQRFLYKNDTTGSGAYNGIYDVTTAGDGSTITVLTRSVNYDTPTNINDSGLVPVIAGTVNAGTGWLNTSTVVTVGVTPIVYVQFGQTAGVISLVNGGTGASLTANNGGIVYSTASALGIISGTATAGQLLTSGSSTTPAWSTSTYPLTNAANTLLYASSDNTMAALSTANSSVLVTDSDGVPSLSTTLPNLNIGTPTAGVLTNTTGGGGLRSFQIFTSGTAQTYTTPSNVTSILVECLGGGGGGGGGTGAVSGVAAGAGGGAGGYARLFIANASSTYTYTVGSGGAGGIAGNNNGSSGGNSTFSASSLQATGGSGGNGSLNAVVSSAQFYVGGNGGVGSNGNFNSSGAPGGIGIISSVSLTSGIGASSIYGGGANGITNATGAGINAGNYGSGGSGAACATTSLAGGNGSAGIIIIWEFS